MARFDKLGEAIRTLREDRRWSQIRLARRAGISAAMLSNYERGVRTPSLETFGKILDALEVHLGAFDQRLGLFDDPLAAAWRLPAAPDGVSVERFLGYSRLPADLLPALSEMLAGFQLVARQVLARALAERRSSG
jgi:transcriptional regulator with XRE-family HTH domain